MSNLVRDLRNAPTPESLASRGPLVDLVKQAQAILLSAAVHKSRSENSIEITKQLRRYALWLEGAMLSDNFEDESSLELAASLYEFAAELYDSPPSTLFRPPLNDLLRSAILASISQFQGRASVVGARVLASLSQMNAETADGDLHLAAAETVASLLARQFHSAIRGGLRVKQMVPVAIQHLEAQDAPAKDYYRLELALEISDAAARAASGMLSGIPSELPQSISALSKIKDSAAERDDHNNFWLADRLQRIVTRMHQTSMHRLLGQPNSPVPARYRRILAREGFLELWGPQLDALTKGILDPNNQHSFVMSIPTGSGKSLLAELAILSSLHQQQGWALYIAPTRSLVNQVSQDLRRRLPQIGIEVTTVLAGAEQSVLLHEEIDFVTNKRSVLVTTPEKLDTYMRNAIEMFEDCRLVIVDEAHKIGEFDRGPLLETLIARFLLLPIHPRMVLLSGAMSNAAEIATWLGTFTTQTIEARRRATRQTFGIAVRQGAPIEFDKPRFKTKKKTSTTKELRKAVFKAGIVLVHEDEDLSGSLRIDVPNAFDGFFSQRRRGLDWIEDRQEDASAITDHAVGLATSFASAPGTVLVFINNTTWAESCARKIVVSDSRCSEERNELASFVSLELGEQHELLSLLRRGIAFHHARLPSSVQRAIEFALERGWLKVVFATSSLREGINTPATTVIVAGLTYWDGSKSAPVAVPDFANMAGRAGRPRHETEGRVILIPPTLAEATAVEAGREYILCGESALRVKTQLVRLRQSLANANGELQALPVDEQRLLLGLKAADLDTNEQLFEFFDRTLWAVQELDTNALRVVPDLVFNAFAKASAELGDRFGIAARVGLSLSSSESIRDFVLANHGLFEQKGDGATNRQAMQVAALLSSSLAIEEIRRELVGSNLESSALLPPLLQWIAGADYERILVTGKETGLFKKTARTGEAVKFCSSMGSLMSWAFGAAWSIIESELDEPDTSVGTLPLLVRYGVPSLAAAYVSLLGVADRSAAQILGSEFLASGQNASLQSVSNWLDSVDVDDLFPRDRHHLRAELLRRHGLQKKQGEVAYEFAEFRSLTTVQYGTELSPIRTERQILLVYEGQAVGAIFGDGEVGFRQLLFDSSRPIIAVVVASAQRGEIGAVIAIRQ